MLKRILVVCHDQPLRITRTALLERSGYIVSAAASDDQAMMALAKEHFDLVLLSRTSMKNRPGMSIDQRIRERYPDTLVLKIQSEYMEPCAYSSRTVDSAPQEMLLAVEEMLADGAVAKAQAATQH